MESNRLNEIIKKISAVKIAVYGDLCLDAYWLLDPEGGEISVETGLTTQVVKRHYYSLGGASNILANISALRPESIRAIGVVGNDIFGNELLQQLKNIGVDTRSVVIQEENFDTMTYVKRYFNDVEEPRVDFGFFNKRTSQTNKKILSQIKNALQNCDVLIFNQQVQNSIDTEFINEANKLFNEYQDKIVIFDSRHFGSCFNNIYRKTNQREIAALNGANISENENIPDATLKEYCQRLFSKSAKPLFVTRGHNGIAVFDNNGLHTIPGIQLLKKLDTVGAGDTVTSALSLCLGAGIDPVDSSVFANLAAAVTVQKLFQTGTATPEEIIEVSVDPDYIYRPLLATDYRNAKFFNNSEIEICCEILPDLKSVEHIVFDHDGTVSTLRQGWEEIMEHVMIKAIIGENYMKADYELYKRVKERVCEYIDKSTGIETLAQMEALTEIVREFGLVPKDQILDKYGYKKIFNEALMEVVNKRIAKLKKEDLNPLDFTVKGAIPFLKALRSKGVKLYLASGTDENDVKNEAEVLGYADLFNGGIYGAVGDSKISTKRKVIQRIISSNNLQSSKIAAVGDGPVEMRESIRYNGIAVGIASDEIKRFGLNIEKRARLVKAGAHIIAPDFSDKETLSKIFSC